MGNYHGPGGRADHTVGRDVTEAKRSEAELRSLLAEQAALRRVATLVAREAGYAEVVAAVAEEVGKLLSAEAARVADLENQDLTRRRATRWPIVPGRATVVPVALGAGKPLFGVSVRVSECS
jgi:hypothetical protein